MIMKQHTLHSSAMAPTFPCGAVVYAREIDPEIFVEWGEAYLLETVNGPIVSRLFPGKNQKYYLCTRDNAAQGYDPIDMPKNAVLGIYRVIGSAVMK